MFGEVLAEARQILECLGWSPRVEVEVLRARRAQHIAALREGEFDLSQLLGESQGRSVFGRHAGRNLVEEFSLFIPLVELELTLGHVRWGRGQRRFLAERRSCAVVPFFPFFSAQKRRARTTNATRTAKNPPIVNHSKNIETLSSDD
jgi:hypothetical protein